MDKVTLRPITLSDTDLIVRWRNSDAVRLNMYDQRILTPEQHRDYFHNQIKTGKISAIRFSTLEAICDTLSCQPGDILEYDPDAELSSLSLTIPSWISSIERTRDRANFREASMRSKLKLTQQLYLLEHTVTKVKTEIEEIYLHGGEANYE